VFTTPYQVGLTKKLQSDVGLPEAEKACHNRLIPRVFRAIIFYITLRLFVELNTRIACKIQLCVTLQTRGARARTHTHTHTQMYVRRNVSSPFRSIITSLVNIQIQIN